MKKQHLLPSEQALGRLPWVVSKLWSGHPQAHGEPHVKPPGRFMFTLAEQDPSGTWATKDGEQLKRLRAASTG